MLRFSFRSLREERLFEQVVGNYFTVGARLLLMVDRMIVSKDEYVRFHGK
jgi:hypothetical protein